VSALINYPKVLAGKPHFFIVSARGLAELQTFGSVAVKEMKLTDEELADYSEVHERYWHWQERMYKRWNNA
jgi:hypothetical protein